MNCSSTFLFYLYFFIILKEHIHLKVHKGMNKANKQTDSLIEYKKKLFCKTILAKKSSTQNSRIYIQQQQTQNIEVQCNIDIDCLLLNHEKFFTSQKRGCQMANFDWPFSKG